MILYIISIVLGTMIFFSDSLFGFESLQNYKFIGLVLVLYGSMKLKKR